MTPERTRAREDFCARFGAAVGAPLGAWALSVAGWWLVGAFSLVALIVASLLYVRAAERGGWRP